MNNSSLKGDEEGDVIYGVSAVYLVMVAIAGGVFNIIAFVRALKARKTELHLILMNLIVSDLAIIFIGIPVDAMGAFTKGEALDAFLCPSVAFVHTIFGMSSLYTLTAMAAIRFTSVIWHERSWHVTTHVTCLSSRYVQLIWLFSFAVAIPPIIGLGRYVVDIGMISCAPDWSAIDTFGLFYNWYLMALGFFLPTVVVVTSNICVFYVSRKQTRKRIRWRAEAIALSKGEYDNNSPSDRVIQRTLRMQRHLAILNLSMTVSFYLSWLPYAADCLLIMCGVPVPSNYHVLSVLFAKSGTVINPILYIFFNKEIAKTNDTLNSTSKSQGRLWQHLNIKENNGNIASNTSNSRVNLLQTKNAANGLTRANKQEKLFEDQFFQPNIKLTMHSLDSGINNLDPVRYLNSTSHPKKSSLTNANDFEIYSAIRSEKRMSL